MPFLCYCLSLKRRRDPKLIDNSIQTEHDNLRATIEKISSILLKYSNQPIKQYTKTANDIPLKCKKLLPIYMAANVPRRDRRLRAHSWEKCNNEEMRVNQLALGTVHLTLSPSSFTMTDTSMCWLVIGLRMVTTKEPSLSYPGLNRIGIFTLVGDKYWAL